MSPLAYVAVALGALAVMSLALLVVALGCIDEWREENRRLRAYAAARLLELEQNR